MNIRTKLTLWYAAVLFASLFLLGGLLYREWILEPKIHPKTIQVEDKEEGIQDLVESLLWSALPAALLGLGGGWLLTRKVLAPVTALTEAARRTNENNFYTSLSRSGNGDELDRLTEVFNEMNHRLECSFQRIREFTLRASHELKTPLTIMRALESVVPLEELSPCVKECLGEEMEEIDRLSKIVDGLTLLTKADSGQIKLANDPVNLEKLVMEAKEDGLILAAPKRITLTMEGLEPAVVFGDPSRLRQLLLNLVDNAVKYNREEGSIVLSLRSGKTAVLTISNTASSLTGEQLERAFEPFFRGDAAHSRDVDGSGLGLAIAKWIVSAHGGTISMSTDDEGTVSVRVELPLAANIK